MSSPRELVQAMIRRRVSRAKKIKQSKCNLSARELIFNFLSSFDDELRSCESVVEKYWLIESSSIKLMSDLNLIDLGAQLELIWHGNDIDSLRLEGVRVTWSEDHVSRTGETREELFDVASILFE
jgi:hypothetical protein